MILITFVITDNNNNNKHNEIGQFEVWRMRAVGVYIPRRAKTEKTEKTEEAENGP